VCFTIGNVAPEPLFEDFEELLRPLSQSHDRRRIIATFVHSLKKRHPQNATVSKERPPIKKEAPLRYKELKRKTSDEKRGTTKTQVAQKRHLMKKEAP
jgi:hypothetical protein